MIVKYLYCIILGGWVPHTSRVGGLHLTSGQQQFACYLWVRPGTLFRVSVSKLLGVYDWVCECKCLFPEMGWQSIQGIPALSFLGSAPDPLYP